MTTKVQENANTLLAAFTTVINILGWEHQRPEVREAFAHHAPENTALTLVRWVAGTADLRREIRPVFGLTTSISIEFGTSGYLRTGPRLEVRVTWPSGGGSVSMALAETSQHLEWVQKAAQVEAVLLNGAVGRISDEDLTAAIRELEKRSEVLQEAVGKLLYPEEGDDA